MAEEFHVATAYVQMETRGDTAPEIEKQQANADRANRYQAQQQRQQQREALAAQRQQAAEMRGFERAYGGDAFGRQQAAEMRGFERAYGGDAFGRHQTGQQRNVDRMALAEGRVNNQMNRDRLRDDRKREQLEKDAAREHEKMMERMKQVRRRMSTQIENYRRADEVAEQSVHNERNKAMLVSRAKWLAAAAYTKMAFGSVPGVGGAVGGAADIASAGMAGFAAGGPAGAAIAAAATAIGKALSYGFQGAAKASPATSERLQYQQDRLQAVIGQSLVPVVEKTARVTEWMADKLGGKGAQLATPQFSGMADMRDRLQMAALRGLPDSEKGKGMFGFFDNPRTSGTGAGIGFGVGTIGGPLGTIVGAKIGDSIEEAINDSWQGSMMQKGYRSVMGIFS